MLWKRALGRLVSRGWGKPLFVFSCVAVCGCNRRTCTTHQMVATPVSLTMVHTLTRTQRVEGTPDTVFEFFAAASNLQKITPPWLHFQITHAPEHLSEGALIEYRLTLHHIPIRWLTRIEEWVPGERFTDVQ